MAGGLSLAQGEGGQKVIPTILIPFDASARTALAVQYATAIVSRIGGNLILYAVIPDEGVRNYAESQLARVAEEITHARVGVTTRVDCCKEVASAIVDTARANGADLIAMETSTSSDLHRWLEGSVTDEVLRQAETPVLIVPAQVGDTVIATRQGTAFEHQRAVTIGPAWPVGGDRPLRILVTLDGSDLARQALAPARALAGMLHAELLLLRVVERPFVRPSVGDEPGTPAWAREQLSEAEQYLDGVAATVPPGEASVMTLAVVGDPPAAIADTARTRGAHLIAMATRGRSGIARQLLGSVATATLQQATVPVLLVRPSAPTP
jgi:nucleotide-binding universal stress UspA family protein